MREIRSRKRGRVLLRLLVAENIATVVAPTKVAGRKRAVILPNNLQ
ncbi:hypothetical protein [Salipaludibacillus sp. CF4.18]